MPRCSRWARPRSTPMFQITTRKLADEDWRTLLFYPRRYIGTVADDCLLPVPRLAGRDHVAGRRPDRRGQAGRIVRPITCSAPPSRHAPRPPSRLSRTCSSSASDAAWVDRLHLLPGCIGTHRDDEMIACSGLLVACAERRKSRTRWRQEHARGDQARTTDQGGRRWQTRASAWLASASWATASRRTLVTKGFPLAVRVNRNRQTAGGPAGRGAKKVEQRRSRARCQRRSSIRRRRPAGRGDRVRRGRHGQRRARRPDRRRPAAAAEPATTGEVARRAGRERP